LQVLQHSTQGVVVSQIGEYVAIQAGMDQPAPIAATINTMLFARSYLLMNKAYSGSDCLLFIANSLAIIVQLDSKV
tara:strand:- start:131 stop:358 length:228 start_codon:yes stop_codon:yes gene_type:complete